MSQDLKGLNAILFETLESLNDPDMSDDDMKREVTRANAIKGISKEIISNARLMLDARKHADDQGHLLSDKELPTILIGDDND